MTISNEIYLYLFIAILGPKTKTHFQIMYSLFWKFLDWPLEEGERVGWSWANYFHLPFCPASAPGELEIHRRNQKTWVESRLCHLLLMWLWVSFLISLGLIFSTGLLLVWSKKVMEMRLVNDQGPSNIHFYFLTFLPIFLHSRVLDYHF